ANSRHKSSIRTQAPASNGPVRPDGSLEFPTLARLAHDERLRLVQFVQAAATVLQVQGRQRRHVALTGRQHEVQRGALGGLALGHRAPFAAVVPLHAGRGGVEDAERRALDGGQFTGGNGAHLESGGVGLAGHPQSPGRSPDGVSRAAWDHSTPNPDDYYSQKWNEALSKEERNFGEYLILWRAWKSFRSPPTTPASSPSSHCDARRATCSPMRLTMPRNQLSGPCWRTGRGCLTRRRIRPIRSECDAHAGIKAGIRRKPTPPRPQSRKLLLPTVAKWASVA